MIGFGFASDWLKSGARFLIQSQSLVMQNQNNCEITFDTQLKTALMLNLSHEFVFLIERFSTRPRFEREAKFTSLHI